MTNNEAMKVIEMFADKNGFVSVDKVREVIRMIGSLVENDKGMQIPTSIPSTNGAPIVSPCKPTFVDTTSMGNPNMIVSAHNSGDYAPTPLDWSPKHV